MEIRYIKEGDPDCPILQLFGGSTEDYKLLTEEIQKLEVEQTIKLTDSLNLCSNNGIKLICNVSSADVGVITHDEINFICSLTKYSWSQVLEKLKYLTPPKNSEFNWLDETSDISLLISVGSWW